MTIIYTDTYSMPVFFVVAVIGLQMAATYLTTDETPSFFCRSERGFAEVESWKQIN